MNDIENIKICLNELLSNTNSVFLVPHKYPDFDAIGACVGMELLCKELGKKCYMVIDDELEKLNPEEQDAINNISSRISVIKSNEIKDENGVLIILDANRNYLIPDGLSDKFDKKMVIDHHLYDERSIKTPNTFIYNDKSSTCEIITNLLQSYGIKIDETTANYLLAGIWLDTHRMLSNSSENTYASATYLVMEGAKPAKVGKMYKEDYYHDRIMQRLVDNAYIVDNYAIASQFLLSSICYDRIDIAKAANYLLKFDVDLTFAIAYIDNNTLYISARSKGDDDVDYIMKAFGGGGSSTSAAALIKDRNINEVIFELKNVLDEYNRQKRNGLTLTMQKRFYLGE